MSLCYGSRLSVFLEHLLWFSDISVQSSLDTPELLCNVNSNRVKRDEHESYFKTHYQSKWHGELDNTELCLGSEIIIQQGLFWCQEAWITNTQSILIFMDIKCYIILWHCHHYVAMHSPSFLPSVNNSVTYGGCLLDEDDFSMTFK